MPKKIDNQTAEEKTEAARPEAIARTSTTPKHESAELEFDEADALFRKRTGV